jgi:hypothetical protein
MSFPGVRTSNVHNWSQGSTKISRLSSCCELMVKASMQLYRNLVPDRKLFWIRFILVRNLESPTRDRIRINVLRIRNPLPVWCRSWSDFWWGSGFSSSSDARQKTLLDSFFEPSPLHWENNGPQRTHFKPPKLPNFDFDANTDLAFETDVETDPTFHSNTHPDPVSRNDADPCRSGSATLIRTLPLKYKKVKFS